MIITARYYKEHISRWIGKQVLREYAKATFFDALFTSDRKKHFSIYSHIETCWIVSIEYLQRIQLLMLLVGPPNLLLNGFLIPLLCFKVSTFTSPAYQ